MLGKGFIRLSSSLYTVLVLIIKKSNGGLRVYINYRALNTLTIKNRNALPLIREILARLYVARIYTKFDIIAAFNKIRMKPGEEEKTTFLIRYSLFEYVIIPFNLYNILSIF